MWCMERPGAKGKWEWREVWALGDREAVFQTRVKSDVGNPGSRGDLGFNRERSRKGREIGKAGRRSGPREMEG